MGVFSVSQMARRSKLFLLQKRTIYAKGVKLLDLRAVCDKDSGQIRVFRSVDLFYELRV